MLNYFKTKFHYGPQITHPNANFNPYLLYQNDIENKRSRLFPDRKRVPGRRAKYVIVVALLIHFWAVDRFRQANRVKRTRQTIHRQMNRRIAPFFQAFTDVHFIIQKNRMKLIFMEILKNYQGSQFTALNNRIYNDNKIWVPPRAERCTFEKQGLSRKIRQDRTQFANANAKFIPGYNIQNI